MEKAILAGGCFWGMEGLIRKQGGVVSTRVGYTGGHTPTAKYNEVCIGDTGHAEAIEVTFDPTKTTYRTILEFFFQMHDPTTKNRQGNDTGTQYRSAIFYIGDEQKQIAEQLIKEIDQAAFLDAPVVTEVTPAATFHEAEKAHQNYLENNPGGYTCHFIRPLWKLK